MTFNEYLAGLALTGSISIASSAIVLAAIYAFIRKAENKRLKRFIHSTQPARMGTVRFGTGATTLASAVYGSVQVAGSSNRYQSDATVASASRAAAAA